MKINMTNLMKFNVKKFFIAALIYMCVMPHLGAVFAATVVFDPASGNVKVGESIDIAIKADLGEEKASAIDIYIPYDSTKFRLVNIAQPPSDKAFYPQFFKRLWEDKIFIGGSVQLATPPKGGSGLLGILTLEPLQAGTYNLAFKCEPPKPNNKYNFTDTNINVKKDGEGVDLVDCTKLLPLVLNVTGGSDSVDPTGTVTPTTGAGATVTPRLTVSPTVTPRVTISPTGGIGGGAATSTPIMTPSATLSATITSLPQTGNISASASFIIIGTVLSVVGLMVKVIFF